MITGTRIQGQDILNYCAIFCCFSPKLVLESSLSADEAMNTILYKAVYVVRACCYCLCGMPVSTRWTWHYKVCVTRFSYISPCTRNLVSHLTLLGVDGACRCHFLAYIMWAFKNKENLSHLTQDSATETREATVSPWLPGSLGTRLFTPAPLGHANRFCSYVV